MTKMIERGGRSRRWLLLAGAWTLTCAWGGALEPSPLGSSSARAGPPQDGGGPQARVRFVVRFGRELSAAPLDGRLLLLLSTDDKAEPRFQISETPKTQQIFGIDVENLAPDQEAVIDETALGYPVESLRAIPAGTYRVQALLHRYETFHRGDGHVVELPMDRGEGQQWNRAPGNLYSTPRAITIEPAAPGPATIAIPLDKVIPPIPAPATTKYIKHERIQSERLTKFWGRPMHLGAH